MFNNWNHALPFQKVYAFYIVQVHALDVERICRNSREFRTDGDKTKISPNEKPKKTNKQTRYPIGRMEESVGIIAARRAGGLLHLSAVNPRP